MELRHLRYFLAVAEELSFTRAAARLQIAQPPLSQQIAKLERELGVQLLERTSRSVRLTRAGTAMLHEARLLLSRADETTRIVSRVGSGQSGAVRIGCIPSGFSGVLLRLLPAFRRRFPDVLPLVYEMEATPQLEALSHGIVDAGLLRLSRPYPGVTVEPVDTEPLVAALPADNPLAAKDVVPLADLADESFVLFPRQAAADAFDVITAACGAAGFTPNAVYEVTNDHTLAGLVAAGLGVSVVPESTSNLMLPGIVYRPLAPPVPTTVMSIALPTTSPSPHAGHLRELALGLDTTAAAAVPSVV